jgi:replicative DNA helicase
MSYLHDAALQYADLGYSVFPCANAENPAPLTPHGFHDATTDLDQISAWWTERPDACIGLATEGLLAVDIDNPDNRWLADDPERAHSLAAAPTSITPGGGRHHVFRRAAGKSWKCSVGKLAANVDTRTDGGYIVVPPSVRPDGAYRWVDGCELDVPLDQLPEPPPWLVRELDALASGPRLAASPTVLAHVGPGPPVANEIPSGQRNATLARLAGTMRRVGMSQAEISAALNQANIDRCQPALPLDEIRRIAASVSRYEPDQIATAVAEDHYGQLGFDRPAFSFQALTSAELDAGDFALEYLIDGLLVKGQPGVIAGPKKSLKTNLSVDLTLSLATGNPFLARFPVARPIRVGMMSGESGAATMQETARRIAASKGKLLHQCENAFWSFDVPQLGNFLHTQALKEFIEKHGLEVLILDPTYLMMMSVKDDAGNLFVVGSLLKTLGDLAQQTGCTPILCHHLKKGVADPYEPAELENIAWAGFQEYVRQWFLLNRRVRYDPDRGGHHELWFSVGGSAGHSGLWGLNVDEGTRQRAGGRYWEVSLTSATDAYEERNEASEAKKQKQMERRGDKHRQAVMQALKRFPAGETSRVLRESAGVSGKVIQQQLDLLLEEGIVVSCEVKKHTRTEPAFRLAGDGGTGGTCWDK